MDELDDNTIALYLTAVIKTVTVASPFIVAAAWAYRTGALGSGWRRLRVRTLGGVTTLERALCDPCNLCYCSLDAGEEVRTLSCNHVFHCRDSEKCENHIDRWLLREDSMFCPVCRKVPLPVLPWKAPPAASPAPAPAPSSSLSTSPSVSETPPPPQPPSPSSSGLEDAPPPQSSPGLEEPLLPPSQ